MSEPIPVLVENRRRSIAMLPRGADIEPGPSAVGGRRVLLRRPRVRSVDGTEVHLESYDTFASVDLLADHMIASMLAGAVDPPLRGRP